MKWRRWESWAVWKLPGRREPEELFLRRHFTRLGAEFSLDMNLGKLPVVMLWAHGDIEWISGEVRHV
jgi:hypothetical protein